MCNLIEWMVFAGLSIAGFIAYSVFAFEILPTLEDLGYKRNHLGLRKWPDGFFVTILKYKEAKVAEHKPLTWWWTYWISLWISIAFGGVFGLKVAYAIVTESFR